MAKVNNFEDVKMRGKTNKKAKLIHRVRNGKEHVYTIVNPNTSPATKAQKDHRSHFGKVNAIVNHIMADPALQAEWTAKREAYNQSKLLAPTEPGAYNSTRKFVFDTISEQLKQQAPVKRIRPTKKLTLPKEFRLTVKPFADLSTAELYEVLKARFNTFFLEQQIRYLDEDNIDYLSTHIILHRQGQIIAYARLFPDAEEGIMRVGRMLTTEKERGKGYGRYLMKQIIAEAKRQHAHTLRLHAQKQAVGFYRHMRFRLDKGEFLEAGIPHVSMERRIRLIRN